MLKGILCLVLLAAGGGLGKPPHSRERIGSGGGIRRSAVQAHEQ